MAGASDNLEPSIRGFFQSTAPHLCDLDRSYIGGIERGERNVSLLNIKKIADALCISPKEFFDE